MDKKKKSASSSDFLVKAIMVAVLTVITLYVCGHISAVVNAGSEAEEAASLTTRVFEHITSAPLDCFHVNMYVAYFVVLAYILGIVMALSRQTMPAAEMKGEEHGSNDFQTTDERYDFLANNTTPVFRMDLSLLKGGGSSEEK